MGPRTRSELLDNIECIVGTLDHSAISNTFKHLKNVSENERNRILAFGVTCERQRTKSSERKVKSKKTLMLLSKKYFFRITCQERFAL